MKMELYTTGMKQDMFVHHKNDCKLVNGHCVIHKPSGNPKHPTWWDGFRMKRVPPNGVPYLDVDGLAYDKWSGRDTQFV